MKKFRKLFLLAPLAVAPTFMYSCNNTVKKEEVKNEKSSEKTTNTNSEIAKENDPNNSNPSTSANSQVNQGNSDTNYESSSNKLDQSEGNAPVQNTQSASGTVEPATQNKKEQTLTPSQKINLNNNNVISLKEGFDYSDFYKYIDFSKTTGKPSSLIYNYEDGTITTINNGKNGYTEKI